MNKILRNFFLLSLLSASVASAQTRLKTADTVEVKDGYITDTVILADSAGELFLEFLKGDRVAKELDNQIYDGEILPPVPVDLPARAPRARMRHVLSFEVISDSNESIELIDQYAAIHAKKRLRLSLASTTDQRRQGAQLITLIDGDSVVRPSLWRYRADRPEDPWQRLGGLFGETSEGSNKVFSAFLYATGVYTIWDENPGPEFEVAFPIDEIELAEPSPFPSVNDNEAVEFDDTEFVEELVGEEALVETEINPELAEVDELLDELDEPLIPSVDGPAESGIVGPVTTSQIPAVPAIETSEPSISGLQALPSNRPNSLGDLLQLPPVQEEVPSNEAGLGQALQANSFQDFGVNEGDLPEAGGFKFPWALLLVIGVIGLSVYSVRQKPY